MFSTSEANFQSWLKERKYDGLIVAGSDKKTNLAGTAYIVFDSNQIKLTTNKNPTSNSDIRFSLKEKITANMTDSERFEILKDRVIKNVPVSKELTKEQLDNIQGISSFEDLNKYFGSEKKALIKKIATEFGVFKEYYNNDIELEFEFSKGNYNESYQKQKHDFVVYAKMFSVFDDVIEKAIGIEVHNRNLEGYKIDPTLKNVYVLASAFFDDENIIPVKLEIKEFNDKNNKLYVAIALDKIKKTEVLEDRDDLNKEVAHSSLSVNISIRDLLKNVNPNDKDFYKYIPRQFFEKDSKAIQHSIKVDVNDPTEKKYFYKLTDGQVKKALANYTKRKVYSKVEAEKIINTIIDEYLIFDTEYGYLEGKSKNEVIEMLWRLRLIKKARIFPCFFI